MVYLYAFLPFTIAILLVVILYHNKELNLFRLRRILWTVAGISFLLTLSEVAAHLFSTDIHPEFSDHLRYAIFINVPTVLLSIGVSVIVQFVNFSGATATRNEGQ